MTRRHVAITGMGCVTALGMDIESLWENLVAKKSGISRIAKFDSSPYRCQIAGEIKNFDPDPWISKKAQKKLDIFSQYALVAVYQALENADLNLAQQDKTRIGVIVGCGMGGMWEIESQQRIIQERGIGRISPFAIPKLMSNAIAAEISINFGFHGPNYVVSAACASSAAAIGCAVRTIQCGEADIVVTGGSEAVITPLSLAGFCATRALSRRNQEPHKACRPFDSKRDGFVMGEGAGILVLEEMEKAKARGATIYGEIIGVARNADAYHITQPSPKAESIIKVMEMALRDAGISPHAVSYINAHGTGTIQNDRSESLAIGKLFAERRIAVSSTKSMLGHLIGAAGAVEAIVSTLSVYKNQIHPSANYEFPDPECKINYVCEKAEETTVQYAISNSFGFGGHNVCLVFSKGQ